MRIGITDTLKPNLANYTEWLKRAHGEVEFAVLSHVTQNIDDVEVIEGLLLTGGGDVDPKYFGETDPLTRSKDVSASRDEFEFHVIERSLDRNLPVLGICRGMQVMNVYLGGTLFLDLPTDGFQNHSQAETKEAAHQVGVERESLLFEITGSETLDVNSTHHQAVKDPGNGLMVSAASSDGVFEGAEWIMKDRMPFLLLVQWHPERMTPDLRSPASGLIAERFMKEVRLFRTRL